MGPAWLQRGVCYRVGSTSAAARDVEGGARCARLCSPLRVVWFGALLVRATVVWCRFLHNHVEHAKSLMVSGVSLVSCSFLVVAECTLWQRPEGPPVCD